MIRNEDLRHYIATISTMLAGPVMNDLQTPQIRELAGIMLILLGRIQTDLVAGDEIAAAALPEWERLRRQAAMHVGELNTAGSSADKPFGWEALDRQFAQIQQALSDDGNFKHFVASLRENRGAAVAWTRDLSQLLARLTRDFEDRFGAASAPPAAASAGDVAAGLRDKLSRYLRQRFAALPEDPIATFSIVSGGQSKLSALLTLKPNAVLPVHLALRLDIPNTSTPMRLDTEYPVLKRVFELGLPVPEPVLFEPDASWLGAAFVLSAQVLDARIGGSPFVEDRRKYGAATGPDFGREAAILLAQLHGRTYDSAVGDEAVARERDKLLKELSDTWRAMQKTPFTLQRDLAIAWLHANPLRPGRPVCLIHGDFVQHNILTRDGKIAALLDWELARLGDPAEDLAQCKMMLIGGVIDWDEFLRVYHEHGGLPGGADPHAIAYYALMLYLKHGVYQGRMRNQFVTEAAADIKGAIISGHFVDRLALYQAEALRDALAL